MKTCCNLVWCVKVWCWTQLIIGMPVCSAPHLHCSLVSYSPERQTSPTQPDSSKMKKAEPDLTIKAIKHQPINIKATLCHISLTNPQVFCNPYPETSKAAWPWVYCKCCPTTPQHFIVRFRVWFALKCWFLTQLANCCYQPHSLILVQANFMGKKGDICRQVINPGPVGPLFTLAAGQGPTFSSPFSARYEIVYQVPSHYLWDTQKYYFILWAGPQDRNMKIITH